MTSASPPRPRSGPDQASRTTPVVRFVRLEAHRPRLLALAASLSADERERAGRFHSALDAERFVLRRGLLRELLGERLGVEPGSVRFSYGRWDKPVVEGSSLSFNASSAGDLAVFAVCEGGSVGVDVELVRPLPDLRDVADRVFSAVEAAELRALGWSLSAFFCGWTQKEAYVKALGDGFAAPLDAFSVPLGVQPGCSTVVGDHRVEVLAAPPGYAAAVAMSLLA